MWSALDLFHSSLAPLLLAIATGFTVAGCDDEFLNRISLEVLGAGSGSGRVTSLEDAVPIDCVIVAGMVRGSCSREVDEAGAGGAFSLMAEPEPGSVFSGWDGCNEFVGDRCQLSFEPGEDDVRFLVTARFEPDVNDPCNMTYGSNPGYVLCSQTPTSCTFYTLLNDVDSCNTRCESAGGTCLSSMPDTNDTCVPGGPGTCDEIVGDRLCECSKP